MGTDKFISNDTLRTPIKTVYNQNFANGRSINLEQLTNIVNDSTATLVPNLPAKAIKPIFEQIDSNKNNSINYGELKSFLSRNYGIDLDKEIANGKTIADLLRQIDAKTPKAKPKAKPQPQSQPQKREKAWYEYIADFFNSFKEIDSRYNH